MPTDHGPCPTRARSGGRSGTVPVTRGQTDKPAYLELAFHYCYVPPGQPATPARLIRAAGLRWPAEEDFEFGKDCFGLDQSPVRLYTAIARHTVLGDGGISGLRRHRRPAARPHRYPGTTTHPAQPAAPARSRHDPARPATQCTG